MAIYTPGGEIDLEKKLAVVEKERDELAARLEIAEAKCNLLDQLEDSFGRFLLKRKPELPTAESLSYKKDELGDEVLGLCAVLRSNMSAVTSLGIANQSLDLLRMQLIADMLKRNTTLTTLNIWSNKLGDAQAVALGEALAVNKTLKVLSSGDNRISDNGAKAIAEGMKKSKSITSLDLWTNNVGDDGAIAIAEAIRVTPKFQALSLWGNNFGDAGVCALCSTLETSKMTSFCIHAPKTTIVGFQALCAMIRNNSTLTRICFSGVPIKGEEVKMLCDALQANTTLPIVDLQGNGLEEGDKDFIRGAVKGKKGFQIAFSWDSVKSWIREKAEEMK